MLCSPSVSTDVTDVSEKDVSELPTKEDDEEQQEEGKGYVVNDEENDGKDPSPPDAEEIPESLRSFKEKIAVFGVWTKAITGPLASHVGRLSQLVIPAPMAVVDLLYLVTWITGQSLEATLTINSIKDVFGEITWDSVRTQCMPLLFEAMANYDPCIVLKVLQADSLDSLRSFFLDKGLEEA